MFGEWARGGELFTDEISSGDVGDTELSGEAAGEGALSNARASQEHPLNIFVLSIYKGTEGFGFQGCGG